MPHMVCSEIIVENAIVIYKQTSQCLRDSAGQPYSSTNTNRDLAARTKFQELF